MKRILVAFDGSAPAARASEEAARIAKALDAKLELVFVIPPFTPLVGEFAAGTAIQINEDLRHAGEKFLAEQAHALEARIPVTTAILEGAPAMELARMAEHPDVVMVAIGRSGHNVIARALLGSVVYRLLHLCPKPVLVVH